MDDGSGEDYTEMLSTMSALGIYASLEIREDGTATINLFDETEDFKVDFKAKKFIVDDNELSYIYKDGILTVLSPVRQVKQWFRRSLAVDGVRFVDGWHEYVLRG